MIDLPLLSIVIFLPLFGALALLIPKGDVEVISKNARFTALLTSIMTFVVSLVILVSFDSNVSSYQFVETTSWLKLINAKYHVGVDGISVLFVVLTTFLTPLAILASWQSISYRVRDYMIAFLVLETLMVGMFCALDIVLFYVFFEGVLIPMYLIIGIWGGERRIYASLKFFLYTFLGSVLMLVAILYMVHETGSTSIEVLTTYDFSRSTQLWLFAAFLLSFAVKVPMWPVHTWLPDAHVEAPTAGSVILAGILLKMGGYGFLRFSLPFFPEASQAFAPYIFGLSIIAVVYTSLVALVQKDMKKLIAYSSVAHMGIATFGTFTFLQEGIQGAIFQMISHGLVSGALFLCVGVIYDRLHTRQISEYGGLVQRMPYYAFAFLLFTFASIGLPGTAGFIGEILVLMAAFKINGFMAFGLATGMVLGASYALWLYRRVVFGVITNTKLKKILDLTPIEKTVLAPLCISVVFFGVYPQPILNISEISVAKLIRRYNTALETVKKNPTPTQHILIHSKQDHYLSELDHNSIETQNLSSFRSLRDKNNLSLSLNNLTKHKG